MTHKYVQNFDSEIVIGAKKSANRYMGYVFCYICAVNQELLVAFSSKFLE